MYCNKNYQHKFDEKLKEQFFNAYKCSNHDNFKFILLLQKGVYRYEYMDDWENFNKKSLPEKEDFYSHLNMEDATDGDYVANLNDKTGYVIHIRNLKQTLYHALVSKKVHKGIKFNQNAWLKPYIDMNTDLRKKSWKKIWQKIFLS